MLLGMCVLGLPTMAVACPPTNVVPDYPYSNTLHLDDGNGDLYYTVSRTDAGGGWLYFKVDAYVTDNWNDDDCIFVRFDASTLIEGYRPVADQQEVCAVSGHTPASARIIWDYMIPVEIAYPQINEITLCRNKEWYVDPCVGRYITFTNLTN